MPIASRWMIRLSLIYLIIGFIIGALILIAKAYPAYSNVWILLPLHIEISIFGWIIQLTMGTAYWILPRDLETGDRGSGILATLMVLLFNAGILVNIGAYLQYLPEAALVWGRLLEITAVVLFIGLHWNRAVTHRS